MALQFALFAIIVLVVLPAYIIYKPPKLVINYLQGRFPQVLFQVETKQKIIALSIDDAPSEYTHEILDILAAHGAHATFFVIGGQVAGRESVLQNVVLGGHELGNHAMHDEPSISLTSDVLLDEIAQVNSSIEAAYRQAGVQRTSHMFRPGSGIFSQRILDVATKAGYRTILGSIYPHDPFISYWWINAWHILSMLRPGAIIICHDRRSWTIPMLRRVVPAMIRQGYQVLTVSQLLNATAE